MKPILRIVLLWIIAIAMPMQSMAASLMTFCGPSHERMMHGAAAQHHGGGAAHSHDAGEQLPTPTEDVADHGDGYVRTSASADEGGLLSPAGQYSCSACAACCSVIGLPANLQLPAQPGSAQTVPAWLAVSVQSHLPEGPDRPPRSILA